MRQVAITVQHAHTEPSLDRDVSEKQDLKVMHGWNDAGMVRKAVVNGSNTKQRTCKTLLDAQQLNH